MYKRLLCLLGNGPDAEAVLARACAARDCFGAELHLLQVVEFLPVSGAEDAMLATPLVLADEMEEQARAQMSERAAAAGVDAAHVRVVQGDFLQEILRYTRDADIDLVVAGKHERRGLSAWFNHAEDDVLHASSCDLLAVHLAD
ncbi:MAG: universal stress protein [Oceanococcaceae bacterium]